MRPTIYRLKIIYVFTRNVNDPQSDNRIYSAVITGHKQTTYS